jgi:hypothetical protein
MRDGCGYQDVLDGGERRNRPGCAQESMAGDRAEDIGVLRCGLGLAVI